MKSKRLMITVGIIGLALFLFALPFMGGYAKPVLAQAPKLTPYLIGVDNMLTGPGAYIGTAELEAIQIYVEMINEGGGINGHPIKLVIYDDGGDATKAVLNVKKLINEDKVLAIVGPGSSGAALACKDTVNREGIVMSAVAFADTIVVPPTPYVFKSVPMVYITTLQAFEWVRHNNWTKIALMIPAAASGIEFAERCKKFAAQFKDMNIVAIENYKPGDIDLRSQLIRIKTSGAQAILNDGYNPEFALILKQMRELNMPRSMIFSAGAAGPHETLKLAGPEASEGAILCTSKLPFWQILSDEDPSKKIIASFVRRFQLKYPGKNMELFHGNGMDATMAVIMAIKKSGIGPEPTPANRKKIRDAMETLEFDGILGHFMYSPEHHCGIENSGAMSLATFKDGKMVPYTNYIIVPDKKGVYKFPWKPIYYKQ